MNAVYEEFCCPICGSEKYNEVRQSNKVYGPGGKSWTVHYTCRGCTVMFKDPEKFTKAGKGGQDGT